MRSISSGGEADVDVESIIEFVDKLTKNISTEKSYSVDRDFQEFVLILWVLYLATALGISDIIRLLSLLENTPWSTQNNLTESNIKRKLYCMERASWVAQHRYIDKTYWYITSSSDPFSRYAFNAGSMINDPTRRKAEVSGDLFKSLNVPPKMRRIATEAKSPSE